MNADIESAAAADDNGIPAHKTLGESWLDWQLTPFLASARRRLTTYTVVASSSLALASGVGSFAYSSLALGGGLQGISGSLGVASLATVVSLLTAMGLYPALRRREDRLLHHASTIAHNNIEILALLGKLAELHDPDTNGHNLRVSLYTMMFCEALGLPPDIVVRATKGALVHDVGKVVLPDRILLKPGPLTPEERRTMQTHVQHGIDLIVQVEILRETMHVVACHHERYDGTGYPRGLKGEGIPREARIFAIIDVFDALTSRRVYKPAYSVADALSTMADQRGSHFDPVLLDRFIEWAPSFVSGLPREEAALVNMLKGSLLRYFEHLTHIGPVLPEWMGVLPAIKAAGAER